MIIIIIINCEWHCLVKMIKFDVTDQPIIHLPNYSKQISPNYQPLRRLKN